MTGEKVMDIQSRQEKKKSVLVHVFMTLKIMWSCVRGLLLETSELDLHFLQNNIIIREIPHKARNEPILYKF